MVTALIDYLVAFYQSGNLAQVETMARNILAIIPDDLVALQLLGLAFHLTGRDDDAYKTFSMVNDIEEHQAAWDGRSVCLPASLAILRAATQCNSGLADGWYRIGLALKKFGFDKPATRAFDAATSARGDGGGRLENDRRHRTERRRIEDGEQT